MVHSDWSLPASQIAVISIRCGLKLWVVFYKRYLGTAHFLWNRIMGFRGGGGHEKKNGTKGGGGGATKKK